MSLIMKNMRHMQNMQNMQNVQNMQNIYFSAKDQKSKISESESSINSRTCLGHLVLLFLQVVKISHKHEFRT